MTEKVIELRSGGLGDAIVALATELTLLVRELAREKRNQLMVTGTAEAINLAKTLHLKELKRKNRQEDFNLNAYQGPQKEQVKTVQQGSRPHMGKANSRGNTNKEPVKEALKGGTKPVEGEVVSKTVAVESPLTHKFPPLTALKP